MGASLPTYSRRYGRTFHGLDNLLIASLCYREIGKVKVDCRLRVSKSQWGLLGEKANPAGIVYMDLSFDQPKDYRLTSATVLITLQEVEEDDSILLNGPHITDHYGPKHLSGKPTKVDTKRIYHLAPQVNVLGSGRGGVGIDIEKTVTYTSQWKFTGQLLPAQSEDKVGMVYRTLKWELTENDLERQSVHSTVIHTGFAFHHNNAPFLMRIKITGKLQRTRDCLHSRMRCFPPPHSKDQGTSVTLVRPDGAKVRRGRLDQIAQSLPHALEMENYLAIPVEVPDALPVSFQEMATSTTHVRGDGLNKPDTSQGYTVRGTGPVIDQPTQPQSRISDAAQTSSDLNGNKPTDPCIANLQRAVYVFSDVQHEDHQTRNNLGSGAQATSPQLSVKEPEASKGEILENMPQKKAEAVPHTLFTLSPNNPVLLLLIRIASFLNLISIIGSARQLPEKVVTTDDDKKEGIDGRHSPGAKIQENGKLPP